MSNEIKVSDFLPKYPDINDENFNTKLTQKKEFYDLKLDSSPEQRPTEQGQLLTHQKIIKRFLSSHTMYDELIVNHSMGTGKTTTAIGAIEGIFKEKSSIKKAVIITLNEDLIKTFKFQILNVATSKDEYSLPIDYEDDIEKSVANQKKKRENERLKLLKGKYEFYTYYTFFQLASRLPEHILKKRFSDTIFVLDEVHHIVTSKWYLFYHSLFHLIENRKILLLSGTLMRNYSFEIGVIMNLILPLSEQFTVDQNIISDSNEELKNPTINDKEEESFKTKYVDTGILKKRLTGRISYLAPLRDVPVVFHGNYSIIPEIKLFEDEMSNLQYNTLSKIQESSYRVASQQASLFVFPNGEYGKNAAKYYKQNKKEWNQIFSGKTTQGKIEAIKTYSSKYAQVIEHILKKPKQNTFVFDMFITGSGAEALAMCLNQFGYTLVTKARQLKEKGKRCAILSSVFIKDKNDMFEIIREFNKEKNKNGDYLSVLIGGRKVSEGVSFRNIEQIHIVSPHWNFSLIDQAIARGIRSFSHTKPNSMVNVYLHTAVKRNSVGELMPNLVDVDLYKIAIEKDKKIQQVIRIIKEVAFDCSLTYERNIIRDIELNNTRECEYQDCLYRCDVEPFTELDDVSYNAYYFNVEQFEAIIEMVFRTRFSLYLSELQYILNEQGIQLTSFQICKVLFDLISINKPLKNPYGIDCYLRQENDILFLVESISEKSSYVNSYYTEFPVLESGISFDKAIEIQRERLKIQNECETGNLSRNTQKAMAIVERKDF